MIEKKGKLLSKVLIVDDDDMFVTLIKSRMPKKGIFLMFARNGEEGIQKAKVEMPDLVITDVVMPKLNGFEMIKTLKEKPLTKDLRFMILSNYGESRLVYDKNFQKTLGVEKYLIKSNHSFAEIGQEIDQLLTELASSLA